jgi:hypothetical protein
MRGFKSRPRNQCSNPAARQIRSCKFYIVSYLLNEEAPLVEICFRLQI